MFSALLAVFALLAGLIASAQLFPAVAAEAGFSAYALGGNGFGAGVAPPPGTYVTGIGSYIAGDISGGVTYGGIDIDASLDIREFISGAVNLLVMPKDTVVLGGSPGVAVTVAWVLSTCLHKYLLGHCR